MKKIFVLFLFCCTIHCANAQVYSCSTKLGIFGGASPARKAMLLDIKPQAMRIILDDFDVKYALANPSYFNQLVDHFGELRNSGIETIFCLRFPKDTIGTPGHDQDRIPVGAEVDSSLSLLNDFLVQFDTIMDYYQLQNEIIGGPGVYIDTMNVCSFTNVPVFSGYDAFTWLDTLAFTAKNIISTNSLSLKMMTPSITGAAQAYDIIGPIPVYVDSNNTIVCGGNHIAYAIQKIVEIGRDYCDAIDIHLNVADISDLQVHISYVDSVRNALGASGIPFTTTEWNQVKERQDEINDTLSWFNTFLLDAIDTPVTYSEWMNYMDSLNYDTSFIENSFRLMQEDGFIHACYNGVAENPQNLIFIPVTILPLLTVIPPDDTLPNLPFYNLLKNLSSKLPSSFSMNFLGSPISASTGTSINFDNLTDTLSGTGYSFTWTFGDGGLGYTFDASYTYNDPGTYDITLLITNSIGCIDSLTKPAYIQIISGMEETNSVVKVIVYPNPSEDRFTIKFDNAQKNNCMVALYNMQGQLVRTINGITTDRVEIERQNLTNGLYFFHLRTDRKIIATGKLTLE
ncbi:MAG: T9SS type A sorting domain-containing protein [Flavobacteriales bacterium]|nr:T9SS type A sorting domain-containing protein [Flavobacteriales bacterium]